MFFTAGAALLLISSRFFRTGWEKLLEMCVGTVSAMLKVIQFRCCRRASCSKCTRPPFEETVFCGYSTVPNRFCGASQTPLTVLQRTPLPTPIYNKRKNITQHSVR